MRTIIDHGSQFSSLYEYESSDEKTGFMPYTPTSIGTSVVLGAQVRIPWKITSYMGFYRE